MPVSSKRQRRPLVRIFRSRLGRSRVLLHGFESLRIWTYHLRWRANVEACIAGRRCRRRRLPISQVVIDAAPTPDLVGLLRL